MAANEHTRDNEHKPPTVEGLAAENERLRRRIAEVLSRQGECVARREVGRRLGTEGTAQASECHLQEMAIPRIVNSPVPPSPGWWKPAGASLASTASSGPTGRSAGFRIGPMQSGTGRAASAG